jgi:deoxyribodipyrimidine photo-lyase
MPTTAIVLFNRDLRVHDHEALAAAPREFERVVPLFVFDQAILAGPFAAPNRVGFLLESLCDLDASLRARGGRLITRRGDAVDETVRVAESVGARDVFVSADVSAYAQRRERRLGDCGLELHVHDGVTAVPPGALAAAGRDHYRVFSPYWRAWRGYDVGELVSASRQIRVPQLPATRLPRLDELVSGPRSPELLSGGETEARRRFASWLRSGLDRYGADRGGSALAEERVSRLSPYLHFGCLSPREAVTRAAGRPGGEPWLRELCWRDFYAQLLHANPRLAHQDMHPRGREWRADDDALDAWRQGCTGLPLVDAGMRQLAREGWMHNRARLVTASFLVNDLGLDWRTGAQHFYDLLLDGDVANNSGNWQWVAGTGVDTRPGRRFNPTLQAKKRDPDGAYIRRYVHELAGLEPPLVHEPWRLGSEELARRGYPVPMVEPPGARQLVLA